MFYEILCRYLKTDYRNIPAPSHLVWVLIPQPRRQSKSRASLHSAVPQSRSYALFLMVLEDERSPRIIALFLRLKWVQRVDQQR